MKYISKIEYEYVDKIQILYQLEPELNNYKNKTEKEKKIFLLI